MIHYHHTNALRGWEAEEAENGQNPPRAVTHFRPMRADWGRDETLHCMKRSLLIADASDGGNNPPPTPPAPVTDQAAPVPHTAAVVLNGERSEREVNLQAEIDELRAKVGGSENTIRARETRINELEDENRQLKVARETPQPVAIKRGQWKKGWKGYALADADDAPEETED